MCICMFQCSRVCSGGVKTRVVECVNQNTGAKVEQSVCDINTKPTAIEECGTNPCQEWQTTAWGQVRKNRFIINVY